jgi:hypothetical protein
LCPIAHLPLLVDRIGATLSLSNGAVTARFHFGSIVGSTRAGLWQWRAQFASINASVDCHVLENIGFGVVHACSGAACPAADFAHTYPGAAMQFLSAYCGGGSGVYVAAFLCCIFAVSCARLSSSAYFNISRRYVAAHDPNGSHKVFSASSNSSNASQPTLSFEIATLAPDAGHSSAPLDVRCNQPRILSHKMCFSRVLTSKIERLNRRRSFDIVFALFQGDWFDASQIYRRV